MRIAPIPSPAGLERLLADVRQEAPPATIANVAQEPLPNTSHAPGTPQSELPEQKPGPGSLEHSLDAQLQKARIASLFAPPFQALPIGPPAQLKALKVPDAGLKKPKPEAVSRLNEMLKAAKKAAESGTEEGRLAVDKVLQKTVHVYGIGQDGVTGLEFDPRFSEQGGTIGQPGKPRTFIVIGKSALSSPEELASTILHESSHVQRNKELADGGIVRDQLGLKAQGVYEALIEIEGYQLEIDNARKLGTSATYVKGAESLKQRYLRDLELAAGKDWRVMAEKGQFKQLHEKFRQDQLKKK